MIIGNTITDSYPFMARSTRKFTRYGASLAPERVLGAKLYPKVKEPTLIHISKLDKTKDYIKLDLASSTGDYIASIYFPLTAACPYVKPSNNDKYSIGYAIQDEELCGCLLGDPLLIQVLKTIPASEVEDTSFIFSPAVCFLRVADTEKSGKLLYNGNEVREVLFGADGGTIVGNSGTGYTINTESLLSVNKIMTVKGIIVNDEYKLGGKGEESIYILAGKDSGVRVISELGNITIGRLMDL